MKCSWIYEMRIWNGDWVPGVVEGANLVGVKRDEISVFVAVIGGVRSDSGGEREEEGDDEGEQELHLRHCWWLIGFNPTQVSESETRGKSLKKVKNAMQTREKNGVKRERRTRRIWCGVCVNKNGWEMKETSDVDSPPHSNVWYFTSFFSFIVC